MRGWEYRICSRLDYVFEHLNLRAYKEEIVLKSLAIKYECTMKYIESIAKLVRVHSFNSPNSKYRRAIFAAVGTYP